MTSSISFPLGEAVTESKTVGPAFLDEAAVFFG